MFKSLCRAFRQQWRLDVEKSQGFHNYYESSVTGERKVRTSDTKAIKQGKGEPAILTQGYQPVDINWLKSAKSGRYIIDGKAHETEQGFKPTADSKPPLPVNATSAIRKPSQK
ncbi:MAG TPA: hypothetical protein EYG18_04255 [Micavibrio sp.]|nr:hypothetical protein [Micavibrio sp.]